MGKLSNAMSNKHFSIKDIVKSYEWLGHSKYGSTELVAFHRDYKPGGEHYNLNMKRWLFPKIWYTKRPQAAVKFVRSFYQEHMCCYGINPRPGILKTSKGSNRRARDNDIEHVMNFYFDIDPASEPSDEQVAEIGLFLVKTEAYFDDLSIQQPTNAFTGRGYHLLFATPPISVKDCPDIKERLNQFRQGFQKTFAKDLAELGLKLDNTMDLSRLVKIYGTKKPTGLRVSRFYGDTRTEDWALRDYLLSLSLEEERSAAVKIPEALPKQFEILLANDEWIRRLWNGMGKKEGDTTNSGYDFSLIKKCMNKGITDINDLAAILALRPKGAVQISGKGEQYIRLTIANAIKQ